MPYLRPDLNEFNAWALLVIEKHQEGISYQKLNLLLYEQWPKHFDDYWLDYIIRDLLEFGLITEDKEPGKLYGTFHFCQFPSTCFYPGEIYDYLDPYP